MAEGDQARSNDPCEGQKRPLRSGPAVTSCSIRFINKTGNSTNVIWINRRGEGVQYKRLSSNETIDIATFVGHPWIFKDSITGERMQVGHQDVFYPQQVNSPHGRPRTQEFMITLPVYSLQQCCLRYISRLVHRSNINQLQLPNLLKEELMQDQRDDIPTATDYIGLLQQQVMHHLVQQQQFLQQQGGQLLQLLQPLQALLQQQAAHVEQMLGYQVINNFLQHQPLMQQLQQIHQHQQHAQQQLQMLQQQQHQQQQQSQLQQQQQQLQQDLQQQSQLQQHQHLQLQQEPLQLHHQDTDDSIDSSMVSLVSTEQTSGSRDSSPDSIKSLSSSNASSESNLSGSNYSNPADPSTSQGTFDEGATNKDTNIKTEETENTDISNVPLTNHRQLNICWEEGEGRDPDSSSSSES